MSKLDLDYQLALETILRDGYKYEDPNRSGIIRKEIPAVVWRLNMLDEGFPALTLKKVYFKGAVGELLFFLSGSTDIRDLWKNNIHFWDRDFRNFQEQYPNNSHTHYDMGYIYPYQYRNYNGYLDQISNLVDAMRDNPMSTSLLVTAWNPCDFRSNFACLPSCHYGFQVICYPSDNSYNFEIHWSQRSTDFFLGTPINIMYYALLGLLLEKMTGYKFTAVHGDLKNVHLYDNQIPYAEEMLSLSNIYNDKVEVEMKEMDYLNMSIDEVLANLTVDDFKLVNYQSYPAMKVDMLAYDKKNEL